MYSTLDIVPTEKLIGARPDWKRGVAGSLRNV
jgi:hypothetical protein